MLVFTACSGSSNDADAPAPTAGAATTTGTAESAVPSVATSSAQASGGTSSEPAASTTAAPDESVPTVWTDPTLPPTSTLPPAADETIGQAVLSGFGYEVCDLIELGQFATGLVGEINPESFGATTMRKLGAALRERPERRLVRRRRFVLAQR